MDVALVGCGRISRKHCEALEKVEGAKLVAVCDLIPDKAESTGRQWGVPWYTSYGTMLSELHPDVVNVCTESGNHAGVAIDVMKRFGCNVIVEKPIALRLSDADAMVATAREAGVRLFTVKQNRFNAPIQMLKRALDEGRFGRVLMITSRVRWHRAQDYYDQAPWRGTWAQDGGCISNQAIHHVDMMQWLGGPVASVYAASRRFLHRMEAEDAAVATWQFASGALGAFEATTCANPRDLEASITVLGKEGEVEIAGFAVNQVRTWAFVDERPEDKQVQDASYIPDSVYGFGHEALFRSVLQSLATGQPNMLEGDEGRKALELVSAMYESIEMGMPVELGTPYPHSRLGGPHVD
ncbi:gfo/Idh/MocA family oxidoreductase [Candidatus Cryosericum hinesii]|uniref:Gfo/Idh/MocA family oxidoreductase n=3 Tax=Candidatus Cryosericaceae TaxID=2498708 RepID=A0A398DIE7_9BACT|nr:gfo/Idh/MocA family oxidoreductase [Candidatus Cryosericum odellii]RIE08295.1 gfo/Idh/MocA family oxidoreductase [Candidatus Cryosericum hinesii]RIE11909.1 gfo/Idh/MocA family oxidoreductase [Candidatus Cryosericum hinesii]RIE11978.1 gfo/Idh/MocA family oxidoreductase [Candidatus Cryosericum hinesii]